jgi:hypothetical protein
VKAARLLPRLVLLAVLAGGVALRLDFAHRATLFLGDQNVVPLMALHIEQGRDFPIYFYGQHYMGGIGPYVVAVFFALGGASDFMVSVAMTAFSLLWMLALYLLFGRLINKWAGVVAAAVVAFGPLGLVRISAEPWVGHMSILGYGTLILYCGVRLNDCDCTSRVEWSCLLGMGALAGLSIWTNPISAPFLIVGLALLAARLLRMRLTPARLLRLGVGFLAFLVTVSPVIVTGARYGLAALFGFRASTIENVPKVAAVLAERYVPQYLAAGALTWPMVAVHVLALAVLVVGFLVGLARRNKAVVRAGLVPLLLLLVYLPFFLTNPLAAAYGARYFLIFCVPIAAAFAFPLVYRRAWVSVAAVALVTLIAVANTVACLAAARGKASELIAARRAERAALVEQAQAAGLRHVMLDTADSYALTWIAREQVIFAASWGERYYPYLAGAVADDNAGFCRVSHAVPVFEQTLSSLGITASQRFSSAKWTVFHHLALPRGRLELVRPVEALRVGPDGGTTSAAALIDQNDETFVGDRYDADSALLINLGEEARPAALRLVAPYEWDYPVGYTISGSTDGVEWFKIQSVGRRDAVASIFGNRLFHRGQYIAMECRFSSPPVRYLKIHDMRSPARHRIRWRFQEAYVYADAGEGARPDENEAADLSRVLQTSGIQFAACDPWLSAKIAARPEPHPDTLPYYSHRHRLSQRSRVLPVRAGVAVVVENAHAREVAELLHDATLGDAQIERRTSATYTAYLITQAPPGYESFPGLTWNGFTLVRTARTATAAWYYEEGARLECLGYSDTTKDYYRRSFELFGGIRANLEKLALSDEAAREALKKLTPEVPARCGLGYGYSLVGYTLSPSPLVAGEPATLSLVWELEGEIPYDYLPVFVHFTGGDAIRFQADHNATFPLAPGETVPRCLVLDEHTFNVPPDCAPGELTIRLGATTWWSRGRRLKPRTELPHRDRAVELGTVTVVTR